MTLNSEFRFEVTRGPAVNDRVSTGGASWLDYDNDSDPDLFATNGYSLLNPPTARRPTACPGTTAARSSGSKLPARLRHGLLLGERVGGLRWGRRPGCFRWDPAATE